MSTDIIENEPVAHHGSNCSSCHMRELCMPVGLTDTELDTLDQLVATRKKVAKGQALFMSGDVFSALYAVRFGTFKTRVTTPDGRDQVTGFHMGGEVMGLDGIGNEQHACDAVALEDSEVCVIPYGRLDEISQKFHRLQLHFHRLMSREIVRDQGVMLLLGSMRSEERLAAFLLNLLQRQSARGYSGKETLLRMTRDEIGSYLGLKLETVSRTLSKMQGDGLIEVSQKCIKVAAPDKLEALLGHARA